MNRNRITRFAAAVAGIAALGLGGVAAAQEPLKIGFVYVSPIGDAGWTFQHDQGRKELEKALGAKVQTKFVESYKAAGGECQFQVFEGCEHEWVAKPGPQTDRAREMVKAFIVRQLKGRLRA